MRRTPFLSFLEVTLAPLAVALLLWRLTTTGWGWVNVLSAVLVFFAVIANSAIIAIQRSTIALLQKTVDYHNERLTFLPFPLIKRYESKRPHPFDSISSNWNPVLQEFTPAGGCIFCSKPEDDPIHFRPRPIIQ